jgi:6-methylsalicylate decarboxylase
LPKIDVHQHLWPEQFIFALSRRDSPPRLQGSRLELVDGRYDVDLEAHRLERRIALLEAYHEGILELVVSSGGRLRALAYSERREGFVGACVTAQQVLDGVGDLAADLRHAGQFLFVHPGIPVHADPRRPPWWGVVVDYATQMEAAFLAWVTGGGHDVPVVFAILAGGGPVQLERLASRDATVSVPEDLYLETSSYGRHALELCIGALGQEHLVYGSDVPLIDSRPTLRALTDLGDAVAEAVCKTNPARLFR